MNAGAAGELHPHGSVGALLTEVGARNWLNTPTA